MVDAFVLDAIDEDNLCLMVKRCGNDEYMFVVMLCGIEKFVINVDSADFDEAMKLLRVPRYATEKQDDDKNQTPLE